jgi:hypothetical protein
VACAEHFWDDLAEELEDALLQDFNLEAEDGSPEEVFRTAFRLRGLVADAAPAVPLAGG